MQRATWADVFLLALAFSLALVPRAHAYLDPGTGSMIIQVLIAVFLGAAVSIRVFWKQLSAFFRRIFHRSKPTT